MYCLCGAEQHRYVLFKLSRANGCGLFMLSIETRVRDADFPLFSVFFRYSWPDPFSADPFPIFRFFPQLFHLSKVYVNILYFLLFHLSLSELSVSFCVHFL